MTDDEIRTERLDAAARAQNALLEHPRCVTHHACPCLQADLEQLRDENKRLRLALDEADTVLTAIYDLAGKDFNPRFIKPERVTPNSDLETT